MDQITVAELIDRLRMLPQDIPVLTIDLAGDEKNVTTVSMCHDDRYGPVGNNSMDRVLIRVE